MSAPIRIFIGSGEQSLLERKTLIHSLSQHARRTVDIYVFNGTHNAIEHNDNPPRPVNLPLDLKYRNFTEFSLYRYLIPEVCGHKGRAIYLDSDMVCLADIGELFDSPMNGSDFLAKPEYDPGCWGLSVMLIDCARCRFDLRTVFKEIDRDLYTYGDFSRMSDRFREHHHYAIGELDASWNVFDKWDDQTKLIHYTDLGRQPWKFPAHDYGDLWFEYFNAAIKAGTISPDDINKTIQRGYVRMDLIQDSASRSRTQDQARNHWLLRAFRRIKRIGRRKNGF